MTTVWDVLDHNLCPLMMFGAVLFVVWRVTR